MKFTILNGDVTFILTAKDYMEACDKSMEICDHTKTISIKQTNEIQISPEILGQLITKDE